MEGGFWIDQLQPEKISSETLVNIIEFFPVAL